MYQSQPIDLAQIFMAAQQQKAAQQEQQLRAQQMEMQRQQLASQQEAQIRERDQREAMSLLPEAMQAAAPQTIRGIEGPTTMPGNNEMLNTIRTVAPQVVRGEEDYQRKVQQAIAEEMRKNAEVAVKQGDLGHKNYSPELVQAANAYGMTPDAGLSDPRVQQMVKSQANGKNPDMRTNNLRQEFQGLQPVKDAQTIATAYNKIMSTSETGAGDMSLIFGYMKLLDPNSTVREGEYATAQNAGSLPQNVVAYYNRTLSGEKLAPGLRTQFKNEAGKVYGAQMQRYDAIANQYKRLAQQSGINPGDVVLDTFTRPKPAETAPPPPGIDKVSDEELRRAAGIQ